MLNNDRLLVQILLVGLLAACLWVLAPFASALFWAAVLAFASWPRRDFSIGHSRKSPEWES